MKYYTRFYKKLLAGPSASPRGLQVNYVMNTMYTFVPGTMIRRQKDNPSIGLVELTQLIAGEFDPLWFEVVAPSARLDLFTEQMAYGPRTIGQFNMVIDELLADSSSRRAIVTLTEQGEPRHELPCTIAMQFQLTKVGLLYPTLTSTFYMRSSDAVWGLPYDMIQFGGIAMVLANILRAHAGTSAILIGNAHVYEKTRLKNPSTVEDTWEFSVPQYTRWADHVWWAKDLMRKRPGRLELFNFFNVRKSTWRVE